MSLNFNELYPNNIWWGWTEALQNTLAKHSKIAETSLGPIEYALHGQGPVVLAIHGTPGGYDHSLWICEDIIDSKDFTLLA
ncbi:MAG: hypothetical protein WCF65_07200 [Parachlamydiaceae bacterium]